MGRRGGGRREAGYRRREGGTKKMGDGRWEMRRDGALMDGVGKNWVAGNFDWDRWCWAWGCG